MPDQTLHFRRNIDKTCQENPSFASFQSNGTQAAVHLTASCFSTSILNKQLMLNGHDASLVKCRAAHSVHQLFVVVKI